MIIGISVLFSVFVATVLYFNRKIKSLEGEISLLKSRVTVLDTDIHTELSKIEGSVDGTWERVILIRNELMDRGIILGE